MIGCLAWLALPALAVDWSGVTVDGNNIVQQPPGFWLAQPADPAG